MDSKAMFANIISVSVNDSEGNLSFSWVIPTYNEVGERNGQEIVDQFTVTMSKSGVNDLRGLLNQLYETLEAKDAPKQK